MRFLTVVLAVASMAYAAPDPDNSPETSPESHFKGGNCFCQKAPATGNGGCEANGLSTLCCAAIQTDHFSEPATCDVMTKNAQWGYCAGNGRLWCGILS